MIINSVVPYTSSRLYQRARVLIKKIFMSIFQLLPMELLLLVGDNFYRAISGTDQDSYLLGKDGTYKSDVELVEV